MAQPPRPARSAQRLPPRRPTTRTAYPPYPPRRQESRSTCGINATLLLFIVLGLAGVIGYVIYDLTWGSIAEVRTKDVRPAVEKSGPPPPLMQEPFNVLLIGVDLREAQPDDGARSDTLIVAHVDPVGKWASMLSIPRDSYVRIARNSEKPYDKINGAYSYGYRNPEIYGARTTPQEAGAALAAETVEQFLGIKIHHTAQVDFKGFEQLIDAIDGITVDVPHAILDAEYPTEDYGYMRLMIEPGLQHMDGITALRYARTRHADNDFGRSQRQQQVIQATLSEVKKQGLLGQIETLPDLIAVMRNSIKTTMPIDDVNSLRGLASLAQEIGTDRIERFTMSPDTVAVDETQDNRYDIHWDPEEVQKLARRFEQGPSQAVSEQEQPAKVQVLNGRGIRGLAAQVSVDLETAGFSMADPGTATGDNPNTMILDYSGRPQTREKLAEFLKLDPQFVRDESANKANAPFDVDIVVLLGKDYEPRVESPTEQQ